MNLHLIAEVALIWNDPLPRVFFKCNFMYFWLCWVSVYFVYLWTVIHTLSWFCNHAFPDVFWDCFVAAEVFLWLRWAGPTLYLLSAGSRSSGFPNFRAQALGCAGFSSCSFQALEHRLSSCGTWPYLLQGMWDLPRSGVEPKSPLAGRFFTTEPPGNPYHKCLNLFSFFVSLPFFALVDPLNASSIMKLSILFSFRQTYLLFGY